MEQLKLNIGCGTNLLPDYINLDKNNYGQERVRDLLRGIPYSDAVFCEILAKHVLEHIPAGPDLIFVMSECWRVLASAGRMYIMVPHQLSPEAFYPDHRSFWNEKMVRAMITDPYQGGLQMKFSIKHMEQRGCELRIELRADK